MRTSNEIIYDLSREFSQALIDGGCFAKKLKQLHEDKREIIKIGDISKIRSNAVQFKLLKQEWRDYLKTKITKAAIQNKECSRSALQNLQRDLFGSSQATKKLSVYLNKNNRSPARIEIIIDPEFKLQLIKTYIRYENDFDTSESTTKQQNLLNLMRDGKLSELVRKCDEVACKRSETVFSSDQYAILLNAFARSLIKQSLPCVP